MLPCPFCGGKRLCIEHRIDPVREGQVDHVWWLRCETCGADPYACDSEEELVEAWNRRANDDVRGENKSLERR